MTAADATRDFSSRDREVGVAGSCEKVFDDAVRLDETPKRRVDGQAGGKL